MPIKYHPKVGEILQCDFGVFKTNTAGAFNYKNIDGRIPPEMVKNRLVVVLNGKISKEGCVVVPISASKDTDKITRKWHVHIDPSLITATSFFTAKDRWAKADHVQQVSIARLSRVQETTAPQYLPRDVVTLIQQAVVKVIGGSSLLAPPTTPPTAAQTETPIDNPEKV